MPLTTDSSAPYAPPAAIISLIRRHRDKGLPLPVNEDALKRCGISESLAARTLQSLRMLDLVTEDGAASNHLEGIRLAPEAEYRKRLQDWLHIVYEPIFAVLDPAKDPESSFHDAFRTLTPTGQRGRMVTLFVGLCKEAGIMAGEPDTKIKTRATSLRAGGLIVESPRAGRISARSDTKGSSIGTASGLPPAVGGLINSLPREGEPMTRERREAFIETLRAVLVFSYPESVERPESEEEAAE